MTTRTVQLNNKGVTLVEIMIALVILLLVFLALMQTALVSIDANMKNVLRDEAVSLAEEKINEARSLPFDSLVSDAGALSTPNNCPGTFTVGNVHSRPLRNIDQDFCSNMTVTDLDAAAQNKQVNIRVIWNWKGEAFMHSITTLIRRAD